MQEKKRAKIKGKKRIPSAAMPNEREKGEIRMLAPPSFLMKAPCSKRREEGEERGRNRLEREKRETTREEEKNFSSGA